MTTRVAIGIDIGGSGIKSAAVDVEKGALVTERLRIPTPEPSTPDAVVRAIGRLVDRLEAHIARSHPHLGDEADAQPIGSRSLPVGVGIPSVVIDGVSWTAANIDPGWDGFAAEEALRMALRRPVVALNDADAAGIAEMRFGAGVGQTGSVLVLTLGTGVGSALFRDGVLVPNLELGHMEIRGRDAEKRSAAAARIRRGLSWKAWTADLDEHLHAIDRLFWPNLMIIGGGVSKRADKFLPRLTVRPPVVPARLLNDAGVVGAAMAVAEALDAGRTPLVAVAGEGDPPHGDGPDRAYDRGHVRPTVPASADPQMPDEP